MQCLLSHRSKEIMLLSIQFFQILWAPRMFLVWEIVAKLVARKAILNMDWDFQFLFVCINVINE